MLYAVVVLPKSRDLSRRSRQSFRSLPMILGDAPVLYNRSSSHSQRRCSRSHRPEFEARVVISAWPHTVTCPYRQGRWAGSIVRDMISCVRDLRICCCCEIACDSILGLADVVLQLRDLDWRAGLCDCSGVF